MTTRWRAVLKITIIFEVFSQSLSLLIPPGAASAWISPTLLKMRIKLISWQKHETNWKLKISSGWDISLNMVIRQGNGQNNWQNCAVSFWNVGWLWEKRRIGSGRQKKTFESFRKQCWPTKVYKLFVQIYFVWWSRYLNCWKAKKEGEFCEQKFQEMWIFSNNFFHETTQEIKLEAVRFPSWA